MPAQPGRHRLVGLDDQACLQAVGRERERLPRPARERPAGAEIDRQRRAIRVVGRDVPGPIEDRAVDRVGWHVPRELVRAAAEREPAVADPAGERRHRVAAPLDRAVALGHEQLVAIDHERCDPAADVGVDPEHGIAGAELQHLAARRPCRRPVRRRAHPARVIARSGRNRNGGRNAGMFENGRTSSCSSIPRASAMNVRRAWIRDQASG